MQTHSANTSSPLRFPQRQQTPFTHKFTQLFSQYGTPKILTTNYRPPFASETFAKFMLNHRVDHITTSPHYPNSNGFTERQVKTRKTSLATATASGKTSNDLLLCIRSTPIGPNLPSPREILHICTEECPGQPSHPVNYEQVRNYLIDKKEVQKKYDQSHNVKPLPELLPGQKVLFLSPKEQNQYIKGTITTKASIPRSYYIDTRKNLPPYTPTHLYQTQ